MKTIRIGDLKPQSRFRFEGEQDIYTVLGHWQDQNITQAYDAECNEGEEGTNPTYEMDSNRTAYQVEN